MSAEWNVVWFTLCAATLGVALIVPPGLLVAWVLARRKWPGKLLVETFITLPLVLPPVATGLLLLRLFGRRGWIGGWLRSAFGIEVVFTWKAVVLALGVMSFPLLAWSARSAFEQVNPRLEEIARTLGAGELRVFFTITLPLAARGVMAGLVLAFARALGEFGATVMVAGNIPGETSTLSLSIYQSVQLGRDPAAYWFLGVSVVLAFGATCLGNWLLHHAARRR
jgi:molybdate transport system permease protein